MRRVCAILLILIFAALASGAVQYAHYLQHAMQDAADTADAGLTTGDPDHAPWRHDDSNCDLHRRLHLPAMADQWVPLLILLGLFVAFLTLLSPRLAPQMALVCVACRGPPAC